jgi:two-component system, NarL family, response regulator NreC
MSLKNMIKILIVDDHKIFRDTLKTSLESVDEFQIIGDAVDGLQAIEMVDSLLPDVVIMDIFMKNLNGIESARQIIKKYPRVKIIILSMLAEESFIKQALSIGVSGYLLKECGINELIDSINSVINDKKYFSPGISEIIANLYLNSKDTKEKSIFEILSSREIEVLQLFAEGKTIQESSEILKISKRGVEKVRQNIKYKLKIDSHDELFKYAKSEGIIQTFNN